MVMAADAKAVAIKRRGTVSEDFLTFEYYVEGGRSSPWESA